MKDEPDIDDKPTLPVSPTTGLDPEVRNFMSRMMAGYESAHRTIAEMAENMSKTAIEAQNATSRAIQMQLKYAEEREELVSKRHKRDLEAQESAQRQASFGQLTGDLRAIALLGLKKYIGIPLTGNDTHGLQDLLKTMSPEQIEKLMTEGTLQLTMAQRQSLMMVLSSLAEGEKKQLPEAAE